MIISGKMKKMKKGFTLIELLIVIGILAILATTVVLVLNPAQLLAETRDTQRVSDLDTLRSAINLYLIQVPGADLGGGTGTFNCRDQIAPGNYSSSNSLTSTPSPFGTSGAGNQPTLPTGYVGLRTTDGNGWVPVNFNDAALGGSPLAVLPIDPNALTGDLTAAATPGRWYAYTCNQGLKTYELNANMESTKYASGGGSDKEGTDGGTSACSAATCDATSAGRVYEVGNASGLAL